MKTFPLLLALLFAAPALAHEEPTLLPYREPVDVPAPLATSTPDASPTPAPTPSPTPMPPLCTDTNPSLTRCLAVMDPAQALNQRVTQLEQRDSQIIGALNELAKKIDAQQPVKKK